MTLELPPPRSISYLCSDCGEGFDLITFTIKKGEPDHNGFRLTTVRTTVREIVEHVCGGRDVDQ